MLLFDSKNAAFLNDVSIVKSFVLTLNTNDNFCFLFQNSFQFDFFLWFDGLGFVLLEHRHLISFV